MAECCMGKKMTFQGYFQYEVPSLTRRAEASPAPYRTMR